MCSELLSIIIPVHNTAQYLKRTLNILECQVFRNFEIIIINDNSSDDTEKIVLSFQKEYNNIKYYKNKTTKGPGLSRNFGLKHSKGNFVTFLDSDDWTDLCTYDIAIDIMHKNANCDFVIWGIKKEYNNKYSSYIRTDYKNYTVINQELALSLLCNTYSLDVTISSYLGNKMFRKSFLDNNVILFKESLFEDVAFSFQTIAYSKEIILIPNSYTHYYQRTHSIVHSFNKNHIYDMFSILSFIKDIVDTKNLHLKKDYNSLVEKCSKTLFTMMYENIEEIKELNKLLCVYFKCLFKLYSLEEILEYLDVERVKNILLYF